PAPAQLGRVARRRPAGDDARPGARPARPDRARRAARPRRARPDRRLVPRGRRAMTDLRGGWGLRGWIAVLAIARPPAGAGGGVLAARSLAPREAPARAGTFAEYEALMAGQFALSTDRREALRAVLASYEADLARIKDRHMADYMSSIEPELRERGRFY